MLIENIDYELYKPEDSDKFLNIRILKGKYINTEFYYGNIKLTENRLKYHVKVVKSPQNVRTTDKQFQSHCGDILMQILDNESKINNYES